MLQVDPRPGENRLDAFGFRRWLRRAQNDIQAQRELIDQLNVFPVPDSDTGTNVSLTLAAALHAMEQLPASVDLLQLSRAAADGAVWGARGNSGLLVSQALSAVADTVAVAPQGASLRPVELVAAYEAIAASTRAAVSRPVEGTLLTVAADAAAMAREELAASSAHQPATVLALAGAAAVAAQESVVETAGLGHGPVDAGAAAFMLILTALADALAEPQSPVSPHPATLHASVVMPAASSGAYSHTAAQMLADLALAIPHGSQRGVLLATQSDSQHVLQYSPQAMAEQVSTGEFEVMYLLEATSAQARKLRHHLESIGDSVGVVGSPDALGMGLFQVHVHTDTPRAALPRWGRARQICIHHLQPTTRTLAGAWDSAEPPLTPTAQVPSNVISLEAVAVRRRAAASGASPSVSAPQLPSVSRSNPTPHSGVIACTRIPGLIEQLARTGAVVVLDAQTEGIMRAIGDVGADAVLVLPCDADSAAAAHQAARSLAVRAMPSTVSALLPAQAHTGASSGDRPAVPQVAASGPDRASAASTSSATSHVTQPPSDASFSSQGEHMSSSRSLATPQVLVADTDDDARVLAAAVATAAVSEPGMDPRAELMERAHSAAFAAALMRTYRFDGPLAEVDAVASVLDTHLRSEDALVTLILGRNALPDTGPMLADALRQRAESLGHDPEELEVVIISGGQMTPDLLVAVE